MICEKSLTLASKELEPVILEAYDEVGERYGSGSPLDEVAMRRLRFHNLQHTLAVTAGSVLMAEALDVDSEDIGLVISSAAAHDVVQLKPPGVMERESAAWLEQRLRQKTSLSEERIEATKYGIFSTELTFIDGKPRQAATWLEYPTRLAEQVGLSVSCGDLSETYSPKGPLLGHYLCQEVISLDPSWEELVQFQRNQVAFVTDYQFPHAKGEALFGELRGAVQRHAVTTLAALEAGYMTCMSEVLDHDIHFMRANA